MDRYEICAQVSGFLPQCYLNFNYEEGIPRLILQYKFNCRRSEGYGVEPSLNSLGF
jgi:hypothetical protein